MKHKPFIRTAALLLALVMIFGVVPTVSYADAVLTLSEGANDSYYLNFPSGGGEYTLDLSDKSDGFSFTLYDDGGADED